MQIGISKLRRKTYCRRQVNEGDWLCFSLNIIPRLSLTRSFSISEEWRKVPLGRFPIAGSEPHLNHRKLEWNQTVYSPLVYLSNREEYSYAFWSSSSYTESFSVSLFLIRHLTRSYSASLTLIAKCWKVPWKKATLLGSSFSPFAFLHLPNHLFLSISVECGVFASESLLSRVTNLSNLGGKSLKLAYYIIFIFTYYRFYKFTFKIFLVD